MTCERCDWPPRFRVKAVGGDYEVVSCGRHLAEVANEGLAHSTAQQGKRIQVTKYREVLS